MADLLEMQHMRAAQMKFAYADPPYLGYGSLYAERHPDALVWDAHYEQPIGTWFGVIRGSIVKAEGK
jgi:hypothetical protein